MKTIFLFVGLLAFSLNTVHAQNNTETLAIGNAAPLVDYKMQDISGVEYSLNYLRGQKGLLVIFSCNGCPFVVGSEGSEGWEGRYAGIHALAEKNGIGMALINSNEAKRDKGDDMKSMQERAKSKGFDNCKYLLDVNSKLANAFFARTTPHVYLFDADMKLVYKGAIDDNVDDAKAVKEHYLNDAIEQLSSGKKIKTSETKPVGCSIKRVG
jgi:hypothetical protein